MLAEHASRSSWLSGEGVEEGWLHEIEAQEPFWYQRDAELPSGL